MGFLKKSVEDFKAFAFKGNVMDLAVGVIIGAAFGAVVTSLVNDLLSPIIGKLTSGVDFKELKWVITQAVTDTEGAVVTAEIAIKYGAFIQSIIYFLLVAISIFVFVSLIKRSSNKLKTSVTSTVKQGLDKMHKGKKAELVEEIADAVVEEVAAAPVEEPKPDESTILLSEIRDLLKAANSKNQAEDK